MTNRIYNWSTSRWTGDGVRAIVTSPALRGIRTKWVKERAVEVYRDNGELDVIAEPIVDASTWYAVREELEKRSRPHTRPARTDSPVTGLVQCSHCEGKIYHAQRKNRGSTYKCVNACTTISAKALEDHVSKWYVRNLGALTVYREEIDQGQNVTAELADTERALSGLTSAIEANPDSAPVLGGRVAELNRKRDALIAERDRPRIVRRVPTGETYADLWKRADGMVRRAMLRSAGVTVTVSRPAESKGRNRVDLSRVDIDVTDPDHARAADALSGLEMEAA